MRLKRYFIFYIFLILISCDSYYGVIVNEYDDFKDQKRSFVRFHGYAIPLSTLFVSKRISTQVILQQKNKNDYQVKQLTLLLNLGLDKKLQTEFYIKTDDSVSRLKFEDIQYTNFHDKSTNTTTSTKIETKTEKDKKSKNKESDKEVKTIETNVDIVDHEYNKVKSLYLLKDAELITSIQNTQTLSIRYYINEQAYTLSFNKKQLEKIKILFNSKY